MFHSEYFENTACVFSMHFISIALCSTILVWRRKLREWREEKGISYKRPPMPVKPQVRHTVALPQPFWTAMKEEEDAHSLIGAVDRSLADCIKLLKEVQ